MLLAESMVAAVAALLTGYIGITLVIVLTGCGLPVPEELPIVTAGVLSWKGPLQWQIALPCCIFGALAGDSAIWWIGYHFGRAVLTKHPWWVGFLTPEREKKAEEMVTKHGLKLLFVARFLPGIRTPVYLTTGILKMPYRKFILCDGLCAAVVVGICFGLGYWYGDWIKDTIQEVERVALWIALAVAAVIGLAYYFKRRRRLAEIRAGGAESNDAAEPAEHKIANNASPYPSGNGADVDDPAREKHRAS